MESVSAAAGVVALANAINPVRRSVKKLQGSLQSRKHRDVVVLVTHLTYPRQLLLRDAAL